MKHITKIFFKLLQTHVGRIQTILLNNISESNFVIRSYWSLPSSKCGLKLQYNRMNDNYNNTQEWKAISDKKYMGCL